MQNFPSRRSRWRDAPSNFPTKIRTRPPALISIASGGLCHGAQHTSRAGQVKPMLEVRDTSVIGISYIMPPACNDPGTNTGTQRRAGLSRRRLLVQVAASFRKPSLPAALIREAFHLGSFCIFLGRILPCVTR